MSITTRQYEILKGIKNGKNIKTISDDLGVNYYTLRDSARALANKGLIERNGRGRKMTTTVDLRKHRPRKAKQK